MLADASVAASLDGAGRLRLHEAERSKHEWGPLGASCFARSSSLSKRLDVWQPLALPRVSESAGYRAERQRRPPVRGSFRWKPTGAGVMQ